MENKERILAEVLKLKVSAIMRAQDRDLAAEAMRAAVAGGFRMVEFTLTTPGAFDLIAEFAAMLPGKISVSPNPFRGSVSLTLPEGLVGPFTIEVFDVAGRRVHEMRFEDPRSILSWDGLTSAGGRAAPGTYFVRLTAGDVTRTRKVVLLAGQ